MLIADLGVVGVCGTDCGRELDVDECECLVEETDGAMRMTGGIVKNEGALNDE